MTRIAEAALALALTGAVLLTATSGSLRVAETVAPMQPFWQLQGAGPGIAPESAAIRSLRTVERNAGAAGMMAESN